MDISTIVGILMGFALIVFGIASGKGFSQLKNFWDLPSFLIVVLGTVAVLIASYPFKVLKNIPQHLKISTQGNRFDPMKYIDELVELAQIARKNGLLALEAKANEQPDPFFKQSLMLIVDGTDGEKIKEMLTNDLDYLSERHADIIGLYEKGSAVAPAFGMIGTLVGLVNMLKNMDPSAGGASTLGVDMSVALVTTFYGCILAHLIFGPIANKLSIRNNEEYVCKQIIIEGVLAIQSGQNPKFLKEKLISFLSQRQRDLANGEQPSKKEGGKDKKGKK